MEEWEKIGSITNWLDLNLAPGTTMLLTPEGVNLRLKGVLTGIDADQCLIVRLPLHDAANIPMQVDASITVRLVSNGKVYGFVTGVLGKFHKGPLLYLFLSYPKSMETHDLRRERRVDCYLPAELIWADTTQAGVVLDISAKGVCFMIALEGESGVPNAPAPGDEVVLRCNMLGLPGVQQLGCLIRNVNHCGVSLKLGLEFTKVEENLVDDVRKYVDTVQSFIERG